MDTKPAARLAALWIILVILLVAGTGLAPASVQAQIEPPTQPGAQFDPASASGPTSGSAAAAPEAAALYPGTPMYDSGWMAINPAQTMLLTHSLGGSIDNYVVDLRFYGDSATLEDHGVNQVAYGGNQLIAPVPTGFAENDSVGAYWYALTTSTVRVYRMPQDKTYAAKFRLRIWITTNENYDSGWFDIGPDASVTRTFSITGGVADNYQVYLEFKDTGAALGIHQRFYGSFSLASTNERFGAYWRSLTDTSITVYRRANEAYVDQARVRIWNQPSPTYDSGWVTGNLNTYNYLTHNIGGNPDDYIVDLQFKDLDNGMGVNQRCYGGCDFRANDTPYVDTKQGAYWRKLTRTNIEVGRRTDDHFADQVRVRIWHYWKPTHPAYDTGWKTTPAGSSTILNHNLGGNANDYLVSLIFSDATYKVNQLFYGVKVFGTNPPTGYSTNQSGGAFWENLTANSITVYRALNDRFVDQWRLRIWRMPKPDYASGWTAISAGGTHVFDHGLVGDRSDFLVDVSFNDPTIYGINQIYLWRPCIKRGQILWRLLECIHHVQHQYKPVCVSPPG